MTIQNVPTKGRISIRKLKDFTVKRRDSLVPLMYGFLLMTTGIVIFAVDPLVVVTNWFLTFQKGSFMFSVWENPRYELYCEVWIFNYTNVPEVLSGKHKAFRLEEVGPFLYNENRTNQNMTLDMERGVLRMVPNINLTFIKELSIADTKDVHIYVPNIALLALSTLAADRLGYIGNAGAYYSISAVGSKMFMNMTAHEYLWGYNDPLVSIANTILPNWIDFGKIGIMDRFYGQKPSVAEVEIADKSRLYEIQRWDNTSGLLERGFKTLNTSTLCNRVKGSYEGLMVAPEVIRKKTIPIYRKQACRVFPFEYTNEYLGPTGFSIKKFTLARSSFNKSSPYACECSDNCLPDGFVDVSPCYYGFPIALSKPHFMDTDPSQKKYFEGLKPEPKHESTLDLEPTLGIPVALKSNIQVNIAVRCSPANPITAILKDKLMPLVWVSLYCKAAPPFIINLLRLRLVIAPPLIITIEVLLFIIGVLLGVQGFYRFLKPQIQYTEIECVSLSKPLKTFSFESSVVENRGFDEENDDKEAVSLLTVTEEMADFPELILTDLKIY